MLRTRTRLSGLLIGALLLALVPVAGSAMAHGSEGQPYTVGMTVDFTGTDGSNYAPLGEALQLFFADVNATGGIGGHKVKLLIRDNKGDDARLSSDFKYFNEHNVNLIYYSASPATLPTYKQAANPNTPVIYGNSCYPPSTPPNPARNFFCVGVSPVADARAMVNAVIHHFGAGSAVKLGDAPSDLPGSSFDAFKIINPYAQSRGATVVDTQVIPSSETDPTPIAQKFIQEGVNAIISFSATSTVTGLAEALKKLGWKGYFISVSYTPGMMTAMAKIKSPTWYGLDWFALPSDNDPEMNELRAAAAKYHETSTPADLRWGWLDGMMIRSALKLCRWPCSQSQLSANLNDNWVRGPNWNSFYGHSVWWDRTTHTARVKAWRVYRFNPQTNKFEIATDWFTGGDPGCGNVDFATEKTLC
jgi:ABC-type branched-subunit amino acid transport system substrate-binding protein